MKYLFIDTLPLDNYGGSQHSAYEMVKRLGKDAFLLNMGKKYDDIPCDCIFKQIDNKFQVDLDELAKYHPRYVIAINNAEILSLTDKMMNCMRVLWMHHDIDEDDSLKLKDKDIRNYIDKFIFVSHWQANRFIEEYNIDKQKCHIIHNGIGSSFEFEYDIQSVLVGKQPIISYTPSEDRGLDKLVDIYKKLRKINPEVRLHIFCDVTNKKIKKIKGVKVFGRLEHKELIKELKKCLFWVYPINNNETFCINAIEAVACGCIAITDSESGIIEALEGSGIVAKGILEVLVNMMILYKKDRKTLNDHIIDKYNFVIKNKLWSKSADKLRKILTMNDKVMELHCSYRNILEDLMGTERYYINCELKKHGCKKKRIGFCGSLLFNHSVGRLTQGLIDKLDREKFDVYLYYFFSKNDHVATFITESVDEDKTRIIYNDDYDRIREIIVNDALDVLIFTSIQDDKINQKLCYSRVASVQVLHAWGYPLSSGSKKIDYVVTMDDCQDHYCEKVINFKNVTSYFYEMKLGDHNGYLKQLKDRCIEVEDGIIPKEFYDLPDGILIGCLQSRFKFDKKLLDIIFNILDGNEECKLIVNNGAVLEDDRYEEYKNQIHVVGQYSELQFYNLQSHIDIHIDPPRWGGGVTSLEIFSVDRPMVTLKSPYLRSSLTACMLRRMNLGKELIVQDDDEFVNKVLQLSIDKEYYNTIHHKIKDNKKVLFNNEECIKEWESFLLDVSNLF